MKEPLHILSAAILLHALVQVVTGIIGLRIAKTLHGFGLQLAQYGRSTRGLPVAPAPPLEPPDTDPALTTADALKSETLRLFELERARKAREGEGP